MTFSNANKMGAICFCLGLFLPVLSVSQNSNEFPSYRIQTARVVISEIMFDPIGSENYDEFVEIVNLSQTDSVDLSSWQIGDGEGFDRIVAASAGLKLAPGQFGLILDSGYFTNSTSYDAFIPSSTLVLTIDGATFGKNGWSNSIAKTVQLLNAAGAVIDQVPYSLGNQPGYSDEKIDLAGANTADNWADCLHVNGTPGFSNSVSPREYDLSLALVGFPLEPPPVGAACSLTFTIKNGGTTAANNFQLLGYQFKNRIMADSLLFYSHDFADTLHVWEEMNWEVQLNCDQSGVFDLCFYLLWQREMNPLNNQVRYCLKVPFLPGALVINEIMYYPQSGGSEWVEIYNSNLFAIDLFDWRISDYSDTSGMPRISEVTDTLSAGDYWVLSSDSLWMMALGTSGRYLKDLPHLPDSGGELFLFDPTGRQIDHTIYQPAWGKQRGFSLERIWSERAGTDSSNWQLSGEPMGTPGRFNGRSPQQIDFELTNLSVDPNPVLYGSTTEVNFTIRNQGRTTVQQVQITLFSDVNRDSLPQVDEMLLPPQVVVHSFVSEEDSTIRLSLLVLPSGILTLAARVNVTGDQNSKNDFQQMEVKVGHPPRCLVVNEIMYQPAVGQSEWLELFNCSDQRVNLRDWFVCDENVETRYPVSVQDLLLLPEQYCVITPDSGMLVPPSAVTAVVPHFPSLNNDTDRIQLFDFTGMVIDAVIYSSTWDGETGISLERINPNLASQDSSNWSSCTAPAGMTPGSVNSIFTIVLPTEASLTVSPNPFSPDGDGYEDVAIIQYNLPMVTATVSLQVYDLMGRKVCELLNTAPSGSHREIIWNGKKNNGESLRLGIYIIYLEALNSQMGVIKQIKIPVVLAGRL